MKYFNISILCLLLLLMLENCSTSSMNTLNNLLPNPQEIEVLNGESIVYSDIKFICLSDDITRPVTGYLLDQLPEAGKPGKGILTLVIDPGNKNLPNSLESYYLEIKNGQVQIVGKDMAGLFYGCQTLKQLMEDSRETGEPIPSCQIVDYPDIPYRAVHIDLKHHLDHMNYYYNIIDRLSSYKINAVIIEFEDKLRYEKQPVVASPEAVSIQQWSALADYAIKRGIKISPLIQGLGHADYILKHEKFKEIRENPESERACCPLNPKTYEMQFDLYLDAIKATPYGEYLHIGGDEVGELGICDACKQSGKSNFELQLIWLTKVCDFAVSHGRIPIFWDDMVLKAAGVYSTTNDKNMIEEQVDEAWKTKTKILDDIIQLFPKECIYMRWNYDNPGLKGNVNAIDWYKRHGLKVMAATAAQCTAPMFPRNNGRVEFIKEYNEIAVEKKLEGILCTAWDDASPHFETLWRGIIAHAEYSWNHAGRNTADFNTAYRQREFGQFPINNKYAFQDELGKALAFWDTALLEDMTIDGFRKPARKAKLISLPDEKNKGSWSKKYAERLIQADVELLRYKSIKNVIDKSIENDIRGGYALRLMKQINEVQIFPTRLLIALRNYDNTTYPEVVAKEELCGLIDEFNKVRGNYENVFSETRFLNKPDNYIFNKNHYWHLANYTKNSDWMYIYEIPFIEKIKKADYLIIMP